MTPQRQDRAAARKLAVLAAAQFLIAIDYSIVYVALPSIGTGLRLSESALQWVVSGYAVFFAGFLVAGGRATDRFGARNLFLAALLLFGLAGLAGGLATAPALLLLARAVQGVAAAALQPAIVALINLTFESGPRRSRALAVWGTVGASGLAAGVILGALLTTVSWRWIFLINLPLAALCAFIGMRLIRPTGFGRPTVLNIPSTVLCTAAVLLFVLALTRAAAAGWTHYTTLTGLAAAVLLLGAFMRWERRSPQPLVARELRRTRTLIVGCAATALYMASVGNEFYVVTLLFQDRLGYLPLAAGMAFLPLAICITIGNAVAGRVIEPLGIRRCLVLAFVIDAAGLALLGVSSSGGDYLIHLLPGLIISGVGHGMTYTSMFVAGTRDIPDHHQGVGAALMTTAQYASGALGVAVLVLVLGPAPDADSYLRAFLTTALAAVIGCVVAWFGLARSTGPR